MNPYDVTSSFTQIVDADREESRKVLSRIDPMRTLADRLSALGLDDRAIWSRNGELSSTLIWRFGDGGRARLDWKISAERCSNGRTMLTLRLAGRGSNTAARAGMLAGWTLIEEMAQAHIRRLARTLDDYANADDFSVAPPRLRAVV
jgi:hypothetical protein